MKGLKKIFENIVIFKGNSDINENYNNFRLDGVYSFLNSANNAKILREEIMQTQAWANSQGMQNAGVKELVERKKEVQKYYNVLDNEQIEAANGYAKELAFLADERSQIENNTKYQKWYWGHYHTDKQVDKIRFMMNDIEELKLAIEDSKKEIIEEMKNNEMQ